MVDMPLNQTIPKQSQNKSKFQPFALFFMELCDRVDEGVIAPAE